jgi:hypothetical protein
MTDYEIKNKLLQFLDIKNYPIMHWFNNIGWEMATYMHEHLRWNIVGKIEDVLQNLYSYLFHSPKKTQKFVKLTNIVKIHF